MRDIIAAGLEELGLSQRVPPEAPELLEAYRTLYQGHFPGAVFRRFVQIPWSRPE